MKGDWRLGHQCSVCNNVDFKANKKLCIHCGAWKPKFTEVICRLGKHIYPWRPWTWGDRHWVEIQPIPKKQIKQK